MFVVFCHKMSIVSMAYSVLCRLVFILLRVAITVTITSTVMQHVCAFHTTSLLALPEGPDTLFQSYD